MPKGGGILPIAIHNNNIYLLFSREALTPSHSASGQWSDFGGGHEKNETPYDTAVREGFEESNGLFKSIDQVKDLIKTNLIGKIETNNYVCYMVEIPWDAKIPKRFKKVYDDALRDTPDLVMKHNGLYEKDKAMWLKLEQIIKKKRVFRRWYHSILYKIENYFKNYYIHK
jgi:8-oxo-dGTP pyrophosphatase MutT (NUDIX family)